MSTETSKRCSKCGTVKPLSDFHANPAREDGVSVYCTPCSNAYHRSRYRQKRAENPVKVWADHANRAAKRRAARAALPFALTQVFLMSIAPPVCPALGIPLDYSGGDITRHGALPNAPTVDRIRGPLGYVPGNVQVISMKANLIKQDATPEEIAAVASHFARLLYGNTHDNPHS